MFPVDFFSDTSLTLQTTIEGDQPNRAGKVWSVQHVVLPRIFPGDLPEFGRKKKTSYHPGKTKMTMEH